MADAYAALDGERVISGMVTIPLRGVWTADVTIASPEAVAIRPVLRIGSITLKGARYRAASYGGARSVRLVGGAGGWRKEVGPKTYQSPAGVPVATVIGDAAQEVGETVTGLASQGLARSHYVRTAGPASRVLDLLTPKWWVRPDGVTDVNVRTSTAITSPFTVTSISGSDGRVQVATEDLAAWVPANTFTPPVLGVSLTISTVLHRIEDGVVRTEILFDGGLAA